MVSRHFKSQVLRCYPRCMSLKKDNCPSNSLGTLSTKTCRSSTASQMQGAKGSKTYHIMLPVAYLRVWERNDETSTPHDFLVDCLWWCYRNSRFQSVLISFHFKFVVIISPLLRVGHQDPCKSLPAYQGPFSLHGAPAFRGTEGKAWKWAFVVQIVSFCYSNTQVKCSLPHSIDQLLTTGVLRRLKQLEALRGLLEQRTQTLLGETPR